MKKICGNCKFFGRWSGGKITCYYWNMNEEGDENKIATLCKYFKADINE